MTMNRSMFLVLLLCMGVAIALNINAQAPIREDARAGLLQRVEELEKGLEASTLRYAYAEVAVRLNEDPAAANRNHFKVVNKGDALWNFFELTGRLNDDVLPGRCLVDRGGEPIKFGKEVVAVWLEHRRHFHSSSPFDHGLGIHTFDVEPTGGNRVRFVVGLQNNNTGTISVRVHVLYR